MRIYLHRKGNFIIFLRGVGHCDHVGSNSAGGDEDEDDVNGFLHDRTVRGNVDASYLCEHVLSPDGTACYWVGDIRA